MGRVITVTGKGGSGKTTVTAFLGAALARREKRVLLVDASLGLRGLDLPLGLENEVFNNLADVLLERCAPEEAVLEVPGCPGLMLLPAAQGKLPLDVSLVSMKALMNRLQELYDYILIDSAPGVERGFSLSISGAGEAILVLSAERASVRAATRFAALLGEAGIRDCQLFFNRMNGEKIGGKEMEEVQDLLGFSVVGAAAEDARLASVADRGALLQEESQEFPGAFSRAASRVLGEEVPPEKPLAKKGFLSRLFS